MNGYRLLEGLAVVFEILFVQWPSPVLGSEGTGAAGTKLAFLPPSPHTHIKQCRIHHFVPGMGLVGETGVTTVACMIIIINVCTWGRNSPSVTVRTYVIILCSSFLTAGWKQMWFYVREMCPCACLCVCRHAYLCLLIIFLFHPSFEDHKWRHHT